MKRVLGYDADGHTIWSPNEKAGPAHVHGYGSRLVNLVGAEYLPRTGSLVQGVKPSPAPTIPTNNQRRRSHERKHGAAK